MATVIYALCALTSIACAVLLLKGFQASGARLLLWAGLCFICLAINNVFLFVDLGLRPEVDLSIYRSIPTAVGLALLTFGLVWEVR
jgi:hypothetical protein